MASAILTATIASSGTQSNALEVDLFTLFGIEFPATMDGSNVTFQVLSGDNSTWKDLSVEGGSSVTIAVDADDIVGLDANALEMAPFRKIRIVSDTTETAERTLYLHCKG